MGYHTMGYAATTDWDAFYVAVFSETMHTLGAITGTSARTIAGVLNEPEHIDAIFPVFPPVGRPVTPFSARKYW